MLKTLGPSDGEELRTTLDHLFEQDDDPDELLESRVDEDIHTLCDPLDDGVDMPLVRDRRRIEYPEQRRMGCGFHYTRRSAADPPE